MIPSGVVQHLACGDAFVQTFRGVASDLAPFAQQKNLTPTAPGSNGWRSRVGFKAHPPIVGQGEAAGLGTTEHPRQGQIGQGPRGLVAIQLPTDVAMTAPKPDLFDMTLPPRRRVPQDGVIRHAGFVKGQSMKAMFHRMSQRMIVERVLFLGPFPKEGQAQPQSFDRVPDANHLNLDGVMTKLARKRSGVFTIGGAFVMPVGLAHVA